MGGPLRAQVDTVAVQAAASAECTKSRSSLYSPASAGVQKHFQGATTPSRRPFYYMRLGDPWSHRN
jgi:formylmethanofuran:tetrahydromethanopterin formyltransferase